MSLTTTFAPSLASNSAVPRPMPPPAPVTTATLSLSIMCFLPFRLFAFLPFPPSLKKRKLRLPQNRHARHRPRTADVVHQTEFRIFDLTRAALPSQLGHDLVDHTHAAGADGMTEGLKPAAGVDRDITVESSAPFFNELGAFALFGKP